MNKIHLVLSCLLLTAATGGAAEDGQPLHPVTLAAPVPDREVSVQVNPPSLRWPVAKGSRVRYAIRLSQDPTFAAPETIRETELRWAMFNPHQRLAPGTWHWQFAVIAKPGGEPAWSPIQHFRVEAAARTFVTPPAAQMLAGVAATRPRILLAEPTPDPAARRELLKRAERLAAKPLPAPDDANAKDEGKTEFERKNFAKWASKGFAGDILQPVKELVRAYRLTGDRRFGAAALKYGLFVAGLDPAGATSHRVSDFADGACIQAMAQVYDGCHDLMTPAERRQVRQALTLRTSAFFASALNNLEVKIFNAHIWQHILMQATESALTLIGDEPEAATWLAYVYELWIARFPTLSATDGGWANGISYFGTNFATMQEMPTLLGKLSGVDFFDHPWFRQTPYYQLYCWPPGSASDGFGDGAERSDPPADARGRFVEELGRHFGDPYALWYAEKVRGRLEGTAVKPVSPRDLPQARAFWDVGIVSMHSDLAVVPGDLMVGFRSSPFGAYNHMHRDQNSFNLNFGGARLFVGSGYYIGYGDDHFTGWYTQTKAQNSVLIDGVGQVAGPEGFGGLRAFEDSGDTSTCVGDASHAYGEKAGLRTFRRHLLLLRPSTLIVYDELEADHRARWDWLLHSPQRLTMVEGTLRGENSRALTRVDVYASAPLAMKIDTRFDPPAGNWRNKKSGGQILEYPDQWHFSATPETPQERLRVLAVIQVQARESAAPLPAPQWADGAVAVGKWRVQAEMDPAKPARVTPGRP